jgi:anti-sigma B factor antagonist
LLALSGRLVIDSGDLVLRKAFQDVLAEGARRIVLELSGLEYADSAGIGEIVACAKRAGEVGGVMRLSAPPGGPVRRLLEVTHLDKALATYPDPDSAVAAFA